MSVPEMKIGALDLWVRVVPFGPRWHGIVMNGREQVTSCERGCPVEAAAGAYAYAAERSRS